MTMIGFSIMILCNFLIIAKSLININSIDKRINEICDETRRQNKRIETMEKRELIRQLEQSHDKTYVEAQDLFKKW